VLSTCASSYVTQYKASFLRGHKLWIVMEYLGGGSCLDLVCGVATGTTGWDAS
jgi:serine/threonine-protein kinase 24/25/MST4